MSGAMTERNTSRPPRLPNMPSPGGPSGAASARSAFAKRTIEEGGVNYLKGAKVGSVTGYLMVSGTIVGKPHTRGRRGSSTPRTRFDAISEMAAQFREMPYCYASMDRKPLMPYTPNAFRSRLAVDDAPVPYKNSSTIEFDDGIHTCHKRRFQTTNMTFYTGEPCDPRSNQGVIADHTRFRRFMQAK
eukprot:CAMPEP_0181474800 /NCGR_PEP_ID=MMETSP1110-20121109/40850_1 /TAXON_ID=174948 /ORGANISM="Symbiodinium sp., Strain CCMP421" /LENGTH=186 /DNA_ID=CAMNT_0023600007 /DNA_START=20 /DNA_END=580 /DNA_ORIENTATION=-